MATTKPLPAEASLIGNGKTLSYNDYLRNGLLNLNGANSTYAITAAGTTQATGFQLNSPYNEVDTVGANSGVNLPNSSGKHSVPYQFCVIYNNGADTLQVYAAQGTSDTINGVAGATGISMNANSAGLFVSAKAGAWASIGIAGNENFNALTATTASIGTLTVTSAEILSDAVNVAVGSVTGTMIGTSANQKLGFFGATPVVPVALSATPAVATTPATSATPYGFTSAQANSIIALLNAIRAGDVTLGLMTT